MTRHINLLERSSEAYAALIRPALWLGLAIAVMAALYGANLVRLHGLNQELAQANRTLSAAEAELAAIVQSPQQNELEQRLERMRGLAGAADTILAQAGQIGSLDGLSAPLLALAEVQEPGLWLTRINLDPVKKTLSLEGNALHRPAVMRYLERLHRQPVLQAYRFSAIDFGDPKLDMASTKGVNLPVDAVHFRID